jgi:two-component system alkaline phosphatase synthesis response regulator PhoP
MDGSMLTDGDKKMMPQLLMIARETREVTELTSALARDGFACRVIPHNNGLAKEITAHRPDLVLVEVNGCATGAGIGELTKLSGQAGTPLIIALVPGNKLTAIEIDLSVDDFITSPYDSRELALRIKRLLAQRADGSDGRELIECDGLVIDRDRCEVTVDGRIVELTFKEYELLCFLAENRGRVFTRDVLLDRVWGYDYYGGDRTVDVHIRRLRGKIEDASHTFIETVRNIGYRFRNK